MELIFDVNINKMLIRYESPITGLFDTEEDDYASPRLEVGGLRLEKRKSNI